MHLQRSHQFKVAARQELREGQEDHGSKSAGFGVLIDIPSTGFGDTAVWRTGVLSTQKSSIVMARKVIILEMR